MERPVNLSGMRTIAAMVPILAGLLVFVEISSGNLPAATFWGMSGTLVTAVLVAAYRFAKRRGLRF